MGRDVVFACHRCARETLPALIADSIHPVGHPDVVWQRITQTLDSALTAFWRAVTLLVLRQR